MCNSSACVTASHSSAYCLSTDSELSTSVRWRDLGQSDSVGHRGCQPLPTPDVGWYTKGVMKGEANTPHY